jgi:two-component system chemotaxis response regulator CheB
MSTTTILVVDDSLIFRHGVAEALSAESDLRVIGSVRNGVKAMEFIAARRPDLVTLDVEMPDMDGLATLEAIAQVNARQPSAPPIGVIMLSALTREGADTTIRALERGAFDFVGKPHTSSEQESIAYLKRELVPRIRQFAFRRGAGTGAPTPAPQTAPATPTVARTSRTAARAILIGVSTGGPRALADMMPDLCKVTTLPILVVQHMPATFTASLAESLGKRCAHRSKEGEDGELVAAQTLYIAPGGRHMLVKRGPTGETIIALTDQPPENGCRPSVDVLFRSAASVFDGACIAIVMTGMGSDGAQSLRMLKRGGASTIAQDEATSVVWGMPGSAVETGHVDVVAPLMKIPAAVQQMMIANR